MSGEDPDYAKRDLWQAVERGEAITWTAKVQIMNPDEADKLSFDPFDVTKVWPRDQFPVRSTVRPLPVETIVDTPRCANLANSS